MWIEHTNSYELATELALTLQESEALVNPVTAPETDNFSTMLDIPDLKKDARELIMKEVSNWEDVNGLKSIARVGVPDYETYCLTIH
jgi:hypothetical protein